MREWTFENRALWARLEAFDIDVSDASLPFSARLARDNNWSEEFAARVIVEYKRFVFLAMRANHMVTPSDEVDQAWHQHLCYTRSYWDEMCGQVLQAPLHHGPTRGGSAEGQKFANWYEKTLESYRGWFGEEPPNDIWPPSAIRFGEAKHFRRINTSRVWIVPKPAWSGWKMPQVGLPRRDWLRLVPLIFVWMLAGCAELQSVGPNVFDWHGGPFLAFFWTLSAVGIGFSFWRKSAELRPLDAVFPTRPLDAFHVARLRDARDGATDVALATLYRKGALEVAPDGTLHPTEKIVALSPFETAVLSQLSSDHSVRGVRLNLKQETARLDQNLRDLGLLVSREIEKTADNWPLGISLSLIGIGAIKIAVGLSRDRPVGFLVMSCAILAGFLVYFLTHPARRSRRGDLYLAHLNQHRFDPQALRDDDFDAMALNFALVGMAAYPPEMQRAMRPPSGGSDSSGGSGCSASSGGDGGGGDGGGGCGGCGGGD